VVRAAVVMDRLKQAALLLPLLREPLIPAVGAEAVNTILKARPVVPVS
jgi:hypothetical protein